MAFQDHIFELKDAVNVATAQRRAGYWFLLLEKPFPPTKPRG